MATRECVPLTTELEFGERPTAVYRLYAAEGELLYVGMTENPAKRMASHAREQSWWSEVSRRTMVWYATREDASAAEDAAIVTENPRYNQRRSHPATGQPDGRWVFVPSGVEVRFREYVPEGFLGFSTGPLYWRTWSPEDVA